MQKAAEISTDRFKDRRLWRAGESERQHGGRELERPGQKNVGDFLASLKTGYAVIECNLPPP